jgi:1-acyl-sn-glycerol-3-phosphate acyltransferase
MACCGSFLAPSGGCASGIAPSGLCREHGGLLIASNHASYLDIPLLGCGIPRRVWYMGRHDLFPIPLLNGLLQALGWIPLRVGRLDRDAFSKAVAVDHRRGRPWPFSPKAGGR